MGEAMACGCVCITNNVSAIPDFIDSRTGILVAPDDPSAYACAILSAIRNHDALPELGRAAAARVRDQCGFDNTIQKEVQLLTTNTT
jgi:glycosyltransferase involved in cell wall biosynthesis